MVFNSKDIIIYITLTGNQINLNIPFRSTILQIDFSSKVYGTISFTSILAICISCGAFIFLGIVVFIFYLKKRNNEKKKKKEILEMIKMYKQSVSANNGGDENEIESSGAVLHTNQIKLNKKRTASKEKQITDYLENKFKNKKDRSK